MASKRRVKAKLAGRKPAADKPRKRTRPAPERKRRGLRSQTLPGMEQVRDQRLDNLCESIVDEREVMNSAKLEEGKHLQSALRRMQERKLTVYVHGELELARIEGEDRIRARVVKRRDRGDEVEAEGDAEETTTEPAGDVEPEFEEAVSGLKGSVE